MGRNLTECRQWPCVRPGVIRERADTRAVLGAARSCVHNHLAWVTNVVFSRKALHAVLDEWREPLHGVRIMVGGWHIICRVEGQFIQPPRSARLVWQYLRRVGPVSAWRKVRSRLAERNRNQKVAAVGIGTVIEAPTTSEWEPGSRVVFFAPNHPEDGRRVCVDDRFVFSAKQFAAGDVTQQVLAEDPRELLAYVGWSAFSGVPVDRQKVFDGLRRLVRAVISDQSSGANRSTAVTPIIDHTPSSGARKLSQRPSVVLFGLGNYAKTQIIPSISHRLDLRCVHEIDPAQLQTASGWGVDLDTSPEPREGEHYDAWFIAGYHHTHAALALRALQNSAYAVVEKPLATSWEQYAALSAALESGGERRLFACFHKRYSRLNDWARSDLSVDPGEPVDMHCIVFEIPLPPLHWYNWPSSGSRIISNGCHWLDYFLFMNNYCRVVDAGVWAVSGSDVAVFARLDNGAKLVMSLTDTGSARLGVRDIIELRAGNVTVRLIDATYYYAENTAKVLRRRRANPMSAYRRMYQTICRRIGEGKSGDDLTTLHSSKLMLQIEDELRAKRRVP